MPLNRNDELNALTASIRDRQIEHIKVGVFDGDGILRGKYLRREKFLAALEKGIGFCDVVLGWDSNDQLFDNVKFTGWHTAYPDAAVRLLPETRRDIPFEPKTLLVLGEFAGAAEAVCPRATLRRVLARASDMGYAVSASAEFEFFMFEETPESVRQKGYRHLKTMTPGNFGYSMLRSTVNAELACTRKPAPASSRRRCCTPGPSKRPTARRCSRPLRRRCASAAA
jgi:glutamine synthetase